MTKLVQVFGNNGSGKTTLLRNLTALDDTHFLDQVTIEPTAEIKKYKPVQFTILPKLKAVLVGNYRDRDKTTAGVDRISPKEAILAALDAGLGCYRRWGDGRDPEWAIWEGIIIMTRQYHEEYLKRGLATRYVFLDVSVEECMRRVLQRSGKAQSDLSGGGKIIRDRAKAVYTLQGWAASLKGDHKRIILNSYEGPERVLNKFLMNTIHEEALVA